MQPSPPDTSSKNTLRLASAIRAVLAEGYSSDHLRRDLMAGIIVGIVALPLSMALAIASGVPPQHGLYTAIIGGGIVAALGGSRVQVSGPTAAFVVLLAPVAEKHGVGGLLTAGLLAGVILLAFGLSGMGRLMRFIPLPVITGFTSGIAVQIATIQVKDFLGLTIPKMPPHFAEKVLALYHALPTLNWPDMLIGAVTLGILLGWPRLVQTIPAPLVGLFGGGVLASVLHAVIPGFQVATIGSRFSYVSGGVTHPGIPPFPPGLQLPWNVVGPDNIPVHLSLDFIQLILPAAFAIAMLGAIESLLSAVVADGMTGHQHDSDGELVAQGIGNIVAPFFGGIAATGAIARTATNIRSGAHSPVASIVHSVFVLLGMMILAPLIGLLPMASLAALLMLVAWNMSEVKHFVYSLRVATRSDNTVLLTCFLLTVFTDMVISVSVGVVLASLLFMRRMADVTGWSVLDNADTATDEPLPAGVTVYTIAGPLFFGAAQRAMSALKATRRETQTVVLDLSAVPMMDSTGLVNLESTLRQLREDGVKVVLVGVRGQPMTLLSRAGITNQPGVLAFAKSLPEALDMSKAA